MIIFNRKFFNCSFYELELVANLGVTAMSGKAKAMATFVFFTC